MTEDEELVNDIKRAFSERPVPADRVVSNDFDLMYHFEAKSVDLFFRQRRFEISGENKCLVAFNYLSDEASIAILPFFMVSIIKEFTYDDFMIDLMLGALATGTGEGLYAARDDIGIKMRSLASKKEAVAVCKFINWLGKKMHEENLESTFRAATKIWCL